MSDLRRGFEWAFESVLSPFERFLRRTAAGGIVLMLAAAAAVALATLAGAQIEGFWARPFSISLDNAQLSMSLHHWVNDGLMAVFFLLVGLELKREILVGELSSLRDAALPIAAAAGGMIVPALLFAALNSGTPYARGWGIPMATDIAFAIGILVLLGRRIPRNLVLFLTALAIADDLGAVVVIAVFYTPNLDPGAGATAAAILAALLALNWGNVRHPLPYTLGGAFLWYFVHASGVHATIAGILLAVAIPARGEASPLERWEHALTPWVTFVVIPIFALANAGVDLGAIAWRDAFSSSLTVGIVAGLCVGKFVGIGAFSAIAVRCGLARLPEGVAWRHLLGAAWLGGIGFTMSLFIAQLAFVDARVVEQAKLGVLAGSAIAAFAGLAWLYYASRR